MSSDAVPHLSTSQPQKQQTQRRLSLRLYLIRHGETESNVQKIVIGQSDSPLTVKGVEQAKALGEQLAESNRSFWRIYSSDLPRAQHTAQLIIDKHSPILPVRFKPRLRELARGAREGLPKVLSEMEAFSERERLGIMDPIPLFETPGEGWSRVSDWLDEVMEDAAQESGYVVPDNSDNDSKDTPNDGDKVLNVLVISHSGLLRIFLERLLGTQRLRQHPDARFENKNGVPALSIPNSSLTILNIDLSPREIEISNHLDDNDAKNHQSWVASDAVLIEQLTSTEHYSRMQAAALSH
ncbi:fructose-2,6-bisphosphatase [Fistulifera solaris]|uniref:Fructose-2,6-bisphosphatase n=1 Tax=Fistulifera solaris TaxID=1519565 RepID=A0A1Z5JL35_FISSO|nr:fructose-2,6-bisphosphatase [Fistulifera solaris]|eukprot:GAX14626.1 fructose-2,6-bisphosphatase [Fistulifera solaris]